MGFKFLEIRKATSGETIELWFNQCKGNLNANDEI